MSKILYTTVESVKARLTNKVQFQSGKTPLDGELPNDLLCQLISDGETDVENELRSRYALPFRSKSVGTFAGLPDHSQRTIRKLVDLRCVMIILATDFGMGTAVEGDKYYKSMKEQYEDGIVKAMGRDSIGKNDKIDRHKVSPPLDDMMLALSNSKADDGFRGAIINTDSSPNTAETYATEQLNNPSRSWSRTRLGGL